MKHENNHKEENTMEGELVIQGDVSKETKGSLTGGWDGGGGWFTPEG